MSGFRLVERDGLVVALCGLFDGLDHVGHAFSTRSTREGESFDLGGPDESGPVVLGRRARLLRAAGLGGAFPFVLRQVHGARVVEAAEEPPPEADGAWRSGSGPAACVRTADCVPILLADREGRRVAALHAGWRGTAAGIAREGVAALTRAGARPAALVAALGPAIGRCCYAVGGDVAEAVARGSGAGVADVAESSGEGIRLDLLEANRLQLLAAGVPEGSIAAAPWCTRCRGDLFFSFRGEGAAAGRSMAAIGLRPSP